MIVHDSGEWETVGPVACEPAVRPVALRGLMTGTQPLRYVWWLVSDASGIVALVLVSVSVLLGLAMAAKAIGEPKRGAQPLASTST